VRSEADVQRVFELREVGLAKTEIARRSGVSRAQVRCWLEMGRDAVLNSPMRVRSTNRNGLPCDRSCDLAAQVDQPAYAYLLGQYLGDGTISAAPRHVFRLRIAACDAYAEIMAECEAAMRRVMPANRVGRIRCVNTISVAQRESVAKLDSFVGPKR